MVKGLSTRVIAFAAGLAWAAFPVLAAFGALVISGSSESSLTWLIGAGAALALAGMLTLPAGPDLSASYAVVAALPLMEIDGSRVFDPAGQAAAVLGGLALLWAFRSSRGDSQGAVFGSSIRRTAGFAAYLAVSNLFREIPFPDAVATWSPIVVFVGAALVAFGVELALSLAARRSVNMDGEPTVDVADLSVYSSLVAAGALFGITFAVVGWWALAVSMLPYGFAHGAFRRFRAAKLTYAQMIRSLGQIPEAAGHSRLGHALRCADLAKSVGHEFGLNSSDLERLEFAALLHDIGRISLNEPAVVRRGYTDADVGSWGAEIIREARYLHPVAEIVRRNHEPFRSPGQLRDDELPLAARIVKAVSAFDEALADTGSSLEAIELLHRGSAYEFDPAVTSALRSVVDRRGSLARR